MWQLTRILQMNPPNSWKMYSQLKQQTQCKLIKLTVACASDALDGRIKAHLNLIPNNWAFDLVDKFFTATFWSTFLRTNLNRGIMEKKNGNFQIVRWSFPGCIFLENGREIRSPIWKLYSCTRIWKIHSIQSPRGQITPATKDTFLHDEWVHNFPLLI